ncbi:MAG: LysR family transcriptional regulator [Sandaracinus sp.]|nr:LysR family transcriptional regulator [Myxococcales bacterium]MAT27997.1 LysR family transcriptional regulator [Sandaracinus sp.]MBJ70974.1 LysR family transcriptional regulator [Sandaracinus sp.]
MRFFLALARHGAVRAAGSALGVSHSTVARRVDALEAQLGVRLFDRHRDGYALTDAGRQMLPGAERVEREMAALERGVVGQDARLEGPVRVTCTDAWVARLVLRALAELCRRHPGISIEIDTEGRNLDLSRREADIALRAVAVDATPPEHLLGRKVAPIVVASYAGVAHLARLDPERGGEGARWLGSERERLVAQMVASSSYPELPIWGAFGSISVVRQAAMEGLGIAMIPTYVGDPDPALRRLTRPDVRHLGDFWLLSHPDLRDNARLQAAREVVTAAFREREALFAGQASGQAGQAAGQGAEPLGAGSEGWSEAAPMGPESGPSAKDEGSVGSGSS